MRPQGQLGDRKNDGFDRATGTYFQVYAPEQPTHARTVATAVSKARDDFAGLLDYWNTIRKVESYRFAYNDRYTGTQPGLEAALAEIGRSQPVANAKVYLARDLEGDFLSLELDEMMDIVGLLPNPATFPLRMDEHALSDVVNHILQSKPSRSPRSILSAPDFDSKMSFNGLGDRIQTTLRSCSYEAGSVEDYFAANSAFQRQAVRDHINALYLSATDGSDDSSVVFSVLVSGMLPVGASIAHHNAAHIMIAYFFESCDVFEDPGTPDAAAR